MITLQRLDHLVLTVTDIKRTCDFYTSVLGCEIIRFHTSSGQARVALRLGSNSPQKINLHSRSNTFPPTAENPQTGSADLCFLTLTPISSVIEHLQQQQVAIVEGPVKRTGTLGPILSVYIRDPDGNLVEVANALYAD